MSKMIDMELPLATRQIKSIIDGKFKGNVRQFSFAMGLDSSSKISRLFSKDKRNGSYPIPSSDIILLVSNTFNCSTDWILKGVEEKETKHINNINIGSTKINGDKNITNSNDIDLSESSNNEYVEIIKKQQEQIDKLLGLLMTK